MFVIVCELKVALSLRKNCLKNKKTSIRKVG